ncbi:FTR1 family protein [Brevibacillus panacihumi]|uniref:FTR1 family iron permease n=1 Tax=Brevibacillus panacihumi TaxID=497735 RepID=UPI003D020994
MKRYLLFLCMTLMLLSSSWQVAVAAAAALPADQLKQLIAYSSDALISSGDQNWDEVSQAVKQIRELWEANDETTPEAAALSAALTEAEQALSEAAASPGPAAQAISKLAKAADLYVISREDAAQPKEKAHKQIEALLPVLKESSDAVAAQDWTRAKESYNRFVKGWYKAEGLVRAENTSVYGNMEIKISGVRIALNTEPPDPAKSEAKLQELTQAVEDYLSGKAAAESGTSAASADQPSISSLMKLLDEVQADIDNKEADLAAEKMDTFISTWPAVEGVVMTKSPGTYSSIENKMVAVPTHLLSNPPRWEKAAALVTAMKDQLEPFAVVSSYTAWDAGLILFREGLEAILIILALLAFLQKSGHADKRKWIWSGAAIGLVASVILAVILSIVLSNLSTGSSRELMEGITGLVAVLFMLTIGAWLHRKSNLQTWNRYVERAIGRSLAKGALWSLGLTAFLAVAREGAETIIFYFGMAASISMTDLLTGIASALILLAIIGYAFMKLSSRIPVRPFFFIASMLLYYMAFKFIGASIHSLQVTGMLPVHSSESLFHVPDLGVYANWETTVPQLAVLLIVLLNLLLNGRKKSGKVLASQ